MLTLKLLYKTCSLLKQYNLTEETSPSSEFSVLLMGILVAVGTIVLSSVACIIGLLCGIKYMQTKARTTVCATNNKSLEEEVPQHIDCHIYEEIKSPDNYSRAEVSFSQNVAYGEVKKNTLY